MKRALTAFAAIALGLAIIFTLALGIQFLLGGNLTSINVHNDSKVPLEGVTIFAPGSESRGQFHSMGPGDSGGFAVDTQLLVPLRIVFDAGRQHYEVSRRVFLPPFGAYFIRIHIGPRMQVSVVRRILW
ncbi:MAG: hypothetical protein QOH88_2492 [Verrucomicrobiota bacterium]|jgi:hypothetical protein